MLLTISMTMQNSPLKGDYVIDVHDIRTFGMNIKLWDYFREEMKINLNNL